MGFAVLHIEKASNSDSAMSAHIERTIHPSNADIELSHLNKEFIKFPDGVQNRTEAIQYRINNAGIKRKISKNQVTTLRILVSGTHEDMKRLETQGMLNEWCNDSIQWAKVTFGSENIVSTVLHLDEKTPHIHITAIPLITGERRKAKLEESIEGKKYRKKKETIRLCADDVVTRGNLKKFQTTYAEAMAKYGLQRGIDGSEAKHISTAQYYRDIFIKSEGLTNEVNDLKNKKQEIESELQQINTVLKKEKVKDALFDVSTTVLENTKNLFTGSKQKEIEHLIEINYELVIQKQNLEKQIVKQQNEHAKEITKFKELVSKLEFYFPQILQLLKTEAPLIKIGIPIQKIKKLFNNEIVEFEGDLYSSEHKRHFKTEKASLKIIQDKIQLSKIGLLINGKDLINWFKSKYEETFRNNSVDKNLSL